MVQDRGVEMGVGEFEGFLRDGGSWDRNRGGIDVCASELGEVEDLRVAARNDIVDSRVKGVSHLTWVISTNVLSYPNRRSILLICTTLILRVGSTSLSICQNSSSHTLLHNFIREKSESPESFPNIFGARLEAVAQSGPHSRL
jgi:hypothetical protein